jgi:hypothetical protein
MVLLKNRTRRLKKLKGFRVRQAHMYPHLGTTTTIRNKWSDSLRLQKKKRHQHTPTNAGEKTTNIEKKATSSVKKPRHQGSGFGQDKLYMTADKTSRKVRKARET